MQHYLPSTIRVEDRGDFHNQFPLRLKKVSWSHYFRSFRSWKINGYLRRNGQTEGQVLIDGVDIAKLNAHQQTIIDEMMLVLSFNFIIWSLI